MANSQGYANRGDVLVNRTADGVDLNAIFDEINEANRLYNAERNALASLLTFPTTDAGHAVPQAGFGSDTFEEATEYGVPRGVGKADYLKIGYTFKDFDLGLQYTWKFLRDASAAEVESKIQRAYEADTKLVVGSIFSRLFDDETYTNDWGIECVGLYNGDGTVPPSHLGQTFPGTTNHTLATASDALDAADLEQSIKNIKRFGYGVVDSARILVLAHPDDVELSGLTTWRAGVEYAAGKKAKFDFIVSSNAPAYLTNLEIRGSVPPPEFNGLKVIGSYGGALVIESYFLPKGYVAVVATGGPNAPTNVIGFREHKQQQYTGLRLIPGDGPYPLVSSYMQRSFGVGVRHRGAAVAIEISPNIHYSPPTIKFAL